MDIAAELRRLAATAACGHLDVTSGDVNARIWVRDGRLGSVALSSPTPALGMRLVSGGKLSLSHLGEALSAQKRNPQMRIGDVLVRMGMVTRQDVEDVAEEQMYDDIATILAWPDPTAGFTPVPPASAPAAGPTVSDVLAAAGHRMERWQQVVREVGGPDTVPSLTDGSTDTADVTLRPEEWGVLCRVDGRRSLQSIAGQAGFTVLEGASILQALVAAGLVTVPAPPTTDTPAPNEASAPPPPPPALDPFDDPSALLRELSDLAGGDSTKRRPR